MSSNAKATGDSRERRLQELERADSVPKTRIVLDREAFNALIRGGILERKAVRIYLAGDLNLDDLVADITAELAHRQRVADKLAEIAREMG